MVNTTAFGKRIQEIMKFYHVSASGFADAMGVGRSSISHILSGRNKPSLDFVMKITEAYPEAELYWLLYGEGTFPKSEKTIVKNEKPKPEEPESSPSPTLELRDETSLNQDLFSQSNPEKKKSISNEIQETSLKNIKSTSSSLKEVDKIVFFYKDGTFEVYNN
ncbi:helix-turn-helix domain-containing protein [Aquimarina litoralis]|uniref:helix-turn-helix domain-containing protein n=1 Tax=Aquimarina litoralis TaxID=584605 RepID=UPI001C571116|nr:helix-turn-helix transcriptional regulator [Aquimarina litoralis]MBW1297225.1 helix-turn-helix domain-containing protein [Aquimarina litoralis]